MSSKPGVSVVMTVLDCDRFIDDAIASVFAQTYTNWELLIVDDGSTDGTPAIIRRYTSLHPDRVRCFEHPGHVNRGTSASRNLGLAHARGAYVAFLDADDVYLPHRIERHVALLDDNPDIDLVQSDTLRWYSWSDARLNDVRIRWPFGRESLIRAPGMLRLSFDHVPRDGFFPSTCSVTFRRAALPDIGDFNTRFAICEDWVFFSKLYLHKNVYVTTDVVAKYRKHRNSTLHRAQADTTTLLGPHFHFHVDYLRWLNRYLQQEGAEPAMLRRARRQLWPDESPILAGLVRLPPALGLACRMVTPKRLIAVALPAATHRWLRPPFHLLRSTKRYIVAAMRAVAILIWSVLPPPGS